MAAETNGNVVWCKNGNVSEDDETWDDSALIEAYDRAVTQMKQSIMMTKESTNDVVATDEPFQCAATSEEEIARRNSNTGEGKKKGKSKKSKGHQKSWKVGDYCRAVYSEDGKRYEAYVKEVNQSGSSCLVQYLGYGNEEIIAVTELVPSLGKEARLYQETNATSGAVKPEPSSDTVSEVGSQRSTSRGKRRSRTNQWGGARPAPQQASAPQHSTLPTNQGSAWFMPASPLFPPTTPQAHSSSCHFAAGSLHNQHHPVQPQIPPPPPFPIEQDLVQDEEALAAMLMSWYMSGYHTGYYQALRQSKFPKKSAASCCMHASR